jgi:hypothetical protein
LYKKYEYGKNNIGDNMYFIIAFRTVFLYLFIVLCYRIMGKKEVGQLGIIDLIVSFSIAELASISIEETDKSIFTSILPITILVLLEIVLGYISKKNPKISNKIIPIQNLLIGVVIAVIEYIITKDFNTAIAISGLIAGGTYDIVHNLEQFLGGE